MATIKEWFNRLLWNDKALANHWDLYCPELINREVRLKRGEDVIIMRLFLEEDGRAYAKIFDAVEGFEISWRDDYLRGDWKYTSVNTAYKAGYLIFDEEVNYKDILKKLYIQAAKETEKAKRKYFATGLVTFQDGIISNDKVCLGTDDLMNIRFYGAEKLRSENAIRKKNELPIFTFDLEHTGDNCIYVQFIDNQEFKDVHLSASIELVKKIFDNMKIKYEWVPLEKFKNSFV